MTTSMKVDELAKTEYLGVDDLASTVLKAARQEDELGSLSRELGCCPDHHFQQSDRGSRSWCDTIAKWDMTPGVQP